MVVILIFAVIIMIILVCSWYEHHHIKQMLCPKCSDRSYYLALYREPGLLQCPKCGRVYSEAEWTIDE